MVDNHVVENPKENDDLLLWGFNYNLLMKTRGGGEGEGGDKRSIEWVYLFINMN